MLIHSNEKPFFCTVCEKAFTQLSHLQAHKKIHQRAQVAAAAAAAASSSFSGLL